MRAGGVGGQRRNDVGYHARNCTLGPSAQVRRSQAAGVGMVTVIYPAPAAVVEAVAQLLDIPPTLLLTREQLRAGGWSRRRDVARRNYCPAA